MWRTVAIYAVLLAAGAVGLQWLELKLFAFEHPRVVWVVLLAGGFLALGVWAGLTLAPGRPREAGERNDLAVASLKVSERELEVLELLAEGRSNKEIAGRLKVSPNTVKTHVSRLYQKLEVKRRTQAIQRARELGILA